MRNARLLTPAVALLLTPPLSTGTAEPLAALEAGHRSVPARTSWMKTLSSFKSTQITRRISPGNNISCANFILPALGTYKTSVQHDPVSYIYIYEIYIYEIYIHIAILPFVFLSLLGKNVFCPFFNCIVFFVVIVHLNSYLHFSDISPLSRGTVCNYFIPLGWCTLWG